MTLALHLQFPAPQGHKDRKETPERKVLRVTLVRLAPKDHKAQQELTV